MSLLSRLEQLEAEAARAHPPRPVHIVTYGISYGDDVPAKRAEARAEFARRNPDWTGPLDGENGPVCLIEHVAGYPDREHLDWRPYLDALDRPDLPENARTIAAYEAARAKMQ
jgi:hypothetical protein